MGISDYLNHFLGLYDETAQKFGIRKSRYQIGGKIVAVEIADNANVEGETAALNHLRCEADAPADLTIRMFDPAGLPGGMPDLPPELLRAAATVDTRAPDAVAPVYYYDSETVRLSWQISGHGYEIHVLLKNQSLALVLCSRSVQPPPKGCIHASPFRTVISWWFSLDGAVMVHAASVGTRHGGVLLCGKGGSGKSTTALSCVDAGLMYAGDDTVILTPTTVPTIHSLYQTCSLQGKSAAMFSFLENSCGPFPSFASPKNQFLLDEATESPVISQFPLRAILALELSDKKASHLEPASWTTAVLAMVPSTLVQFSGDSQQRLNQLSHYAAMIPTFTLKVGCDVKQIPQPIIQLLKDLNPEEAP